MPAEFRIISERVCIIKYSDPLLAVEMDRSSAELTAYANTSPQSVLVIGDYTEVTRLSAALVSVGLRPGSLNPLRNPTIIKIVVITSLSILSPLASSVSKILGINKIVVVQTQMQVEAEVEAFLQQRRSEV